MLSVTEAAARIRGRMTRIGAEAVSIWDAGGRVLAANLVAARALPPLDLSAMDGFAARAADLPATLPVAGAIAAGHPWAGPLPAGAVLRIMTGAAMPDGADTVVILEDAQVDGARVTLPASRTGANVRRAGEDVALGAHVLARGTRLDAGALALAAALGHVTLEVARRPRVAILATGDELVDVTVEPGPGQIVDSSAHAVAALVRAAGGEPRYLGVVRDDRAATTAALRGALDHDLVITTGGVSAGDHDHVRPALAEAGIELELWKVAMKPGKPIAFAVAPSGVPVFGLPGNPVSTMVAFELFVRPALLAMQGATAIDRPRAPVVLPDGYDKPAGRAHYLRARLERDGATLVARVHPKQGSAMMTSMIGVDALLEIHAELTRVPPGTIVPAILLEAR